MATWNYIVIIASLLFLAFICWKEWQRLNKPRLGLRLFASFLAVASFACLALPLTRKVEATSLHGKKAVLLTEGFNKDSVNAFLNANSNALVYTLDNNLQAALKNYKTKFLTGAELDLLKEQVSAIHVYGYGLDQHDLDVLPSTSMVFHPAKVVNGITAVNWQHKIKSGDRLRVQGNFVNSTGSSVKLIFAGYDVNLDTAIIPANKNENFELSAVPGQFGKAVYSLIAIAGKDTLEKEPVPFEIDQPENMRIFILSASPDFENKFLKTWLSQNNYSVVTRTTISKGKYEKTFLNTARSSFNNITASFLQDFNLVIADVSELAALGRPELAIIESQVAQRGMGLIFKGDSDSAGSSFFSRPFPVLQSAAVKEKDLSIYIPVSNRYASVSVTGNPVFIRPQPGTKSLIEDKQSNIIVSSTIHGSGRLIYTTLNNTFTWMLSGDNKTYQSFWSYLLEEVTAKSGVDRSWSIKPEYPYAGKPVGLNYTSNTLQIPQVQVGQDFVRLVQNPDLPFQWQGTYWPERSGWQPVMQANERTFWWYAYGTDDWKPVAALQKTKATLQRATANTNNASEIEEKVWVRVPVSKVYFLVLFLCCAAFLWLEKKL